MHIVPNKGRLIVEIIKKQEGLIWTPTGQEIRIGENLFICSVVHPGETPLKKGQLVICSEYSMSGFYKDPQKLIDETVTDAEAKEPKNKHYIVAELDVMAYDED